MEINFTWISSPRGICKLLNFVLCLIGLSLVSHYGLIVEMNKSHFSYSIISGYLFLSAAYIIGYAFDSTMGKQPSQEFATSASGIILLLTAAALIFEGYSKTSDILPRIAEIRKANLAAAIFILTSSIVHGCDFFFNFKNRSSST